MRHDDLLVDAARPGAPAAAGRDRAEAMAEEVGVEYGRAMAARMAPGRPTSTGRSRPRLHAVADALTAHGFAAHAERHGDELRIVSEHCPFGGAADRAPGDLRRRPRHGRGMLGALYGQADATDDASSRPNWATTTASPRVTGLSAERAVTAALPRPRVDLAAAARGAWRRCRVARSTWPATPGASTPRA